MQYFTGVSRLKRKFFRVLACLLAMLTLAATPLAVMPTAEAASTMKIVKVNVQGARLREGPSSEYDIITSLDKGEKVFYSGKTKNAFSYVCTADGKVGFVYKGYLSAYGTVRTAQVYYTTGNGVRMYKKPRTSASRVATLKQQYVIVYQKAGNWAQVRTLEGKSGYIQLSKLKKANW